MGLVQVRNWQFNSKDCIVEILPPSKVVVKIRELASTSFTSLVQTDKHRSSSCPHERNLRKQRTIVLAQ